MVVKIQKMFVWMCVFCKFIATANKAFTNGKILRKTAKTLPQATTMHHLKFLIKLLLQDFDQPFMKSGPKLRLKTLNILQFLSFSNVGQ